MIKSHDIFDTLIGRLCYNGKYIFSIIEKKKNIPNFRINRIKFETQTKNFDKTYELLSAYYKQDMTYIKEYELYLEFELSFPIVNHLNSVENNDILISDMYLSESQIRNLIHKHRKINNKIYVSYDGKKNKTIWTTKDITKHIECHFGDNYTSDFKNPTSCGVNAVYINDTILSKKEKDFEYIDDKLAYLLRAVRLSIDRKISPFTDLFTNFALPFGILICLYLNSLMKEDYIENIIFLSRDGYWFKEIYDTLFPNDKTHYIYFSRLFALKNPSDLKKEFAKIKGSKIVFDLQGSGRTFFSLDIKDCQYFMCFLSKKHDKKNQKFLFDDNSPLASIKSIIEDTYLAPHGSVKNINNQHIELLKPEHDLELFNCYFKGINLFRKYLDIMRKYSDISFQFESNKLKYMLDNYIIKSPNEIIQKICSNITHVNEHTALYPEYPMTFYSQIGQDKYYVENIIKFKMGGTFLEIGGYDGITGSNTYYLEKNLHWDGIIVECNPELAQKCRETRTCFICDKALHSHDNETVIFTIPIGSEIKGGKEQLGGIKSLLKKESIKVFSKSYEKSKEISVKTVSINTLLKQRQIDHIDFVSLDVEGGELAILESWDFDKHKVSFMTVEHGNIPRYQNQIRSILTQRGFTLHRNNKWDDEYIFQTLIT